METHPAALDLPADCQQCSCRAFADFLRRFDKEQPKIPTGLYPEYRDWLAWAKERTP